MSNRTLNTLLIFAAIFLFAVLGFTLYTISMIISDGLTVTLIADMAQFLTTAFAIYYILAGCNKKDGARYFRMFMILNALSILIQLAFVDQTAIFRLMFAVIFASLCLLAFAKDLGQKKSITLASIVVAFSVVALVLELVVAKATEYAALTVFVTQVILGLATLLMVVAKYDDKKQRGSKT